MGACLDSTPAGQPRFLEATLAGESAKRVLDFSGMSQDAVAAARLRLALDLFATGEGLARQRLRRLHPEWTASEIDDEIVAWLSRRPGAETGDGEGRPVAWTSRVK